MSHDSENTLNDMARRYHFGGGANNWQRDSVGRNGENRESESGNVDHWDADAHGDCEDRMLHQWQSMRTTNPELARASRPVLFRDQPDAQGRSSGPGHIALEVHTNQGVRVLDTQYSHLRNLSDYAGKRVYHAEGPTGVGGRWTQSELIENPRPMTTVDSSATHVTPGGR